ncbi:MAG: TetR/AcrR family transcriptional regulator, partial [Frondihabitans sp.]|nr:TetR/AcrR family transcriptional regulator [Frondihabitans sp.]
AIVDAVIPLVLEYGADVTTRQMAEASGVAEGTLFRAFGDKDSIIQAAVETYLDPEPLRSAIRDIDGTLPLEVKVRAILEILQKRFAGVFQMMHASGRHGPPPALTGRHDYATLVGDALRSDADDLAWPAERIAPLLRLLAFSTSLPQFSRNTSFTLDELTTFALHGITHPREAATPTRQQAIPQDPAA